MTYPATAIIWDVGVLRFRVCRLEGVLDNVPIYTPLKDRNYEKREDAIRSAAHWPVKYQPS